jgi:hypothetical protein
MIRRSDQKLSSNPHGAPSVVATAFPHGRNGLLEASVSDLARHAEHLSQASLAERIELADACLRGVFAHAREWVDACCNAKGIPADSPCRAEEITLGPLIAARQLRLMIQTFKDIQTHGSPQLPGPPRVTSDGRLRVPVLPVRGMYDNLMFPGFRANAWMQPGVTKDDLFQPLSNGNTPAISLVLGAGNVSSIPATDAFGKIFHDGQTVLLKIHPVNDYLGSIFERAFQPLVESGYLRIISGDATIGAAAVAQRLVNNVHITGSIDTHDRIVWGPPGGEFDTRRDEQHRVLDKPITSELGNVSPWIIVPGEYSRGQIAFQAENVAASIVNNAAFGCASTRVIVTWKQWPQRQRFLDAVQRVLANTPERVAYYPGAVQRYRQFTGMDVQADAENKLPWTLIRGLDPAEPSPLFARESFVCICAEIALDGESPAEFLQQATDFVNERLWGTLCAGLTLPPRYRRTPQQEADLQDCLGRMRYGCVGINQWPGLMYGLVSPGWGGYPGTTLADAQSGLGWVHNTYRLQRVEKTVMEGPLTFSPKPLWFPSHAAPEPVAWAALHLYENSSVTRVPRLLYHALKGQLMS